jgi:hypothetical protein
MAKQEKVIEGSERDGATNLVGGLGDVWGGGPAQKPFLVAGHVALATPRPAGVDDLVIGHSERCRIADRGEAQVLCDAVSAARVYA